MCIRQNDSKNLAATDQSVVPSEIVIEEQLEAGCLTRAQRLNCPLSNLGFETTAPHRSLNTTVGVEKRFGAGFLRAGSFYPRDDAQGHRLAFFRGPRQF